jgi:hypothetical protein
MSTCVLADYLLSDGPLVYFISASAVSDWIRLWILFVLWRRFMFLFHDFMLWLRFRTLVRHDYTSWFCVMQVLFFTSSIVLWYCYACNSKLSKRARVWVDWVFLNLSGVSSASTSWIRVCRWLSVLSGFYCLQGFLCFSKINIGGNCCEYFLKQFYLTSPVSRFAAIDISQRIGVSSASTSWIRATGVR